MNGMRHEGVPMHETATTGEGTVPMTGSDRPDSTVPQTLAERRSRLRGWGGVGAMAGACALALVATLSLACGGPSHAGATTTPAGLGLAQARPASDASCSHPEASLRPSSASGPAVQRIRQRGYLIVGVDQDRKSVV